MGTWKTKRNDTYPPLETTLTDADGLAVNLAGSTVAFIMRSTGDSSVKVQSAMAFVTDGTDGKVEYEWQAADTDEAGLFLAEYQVIYGSGEKQTFPTVGYDKVLIYGDLDDS